MKWLGFTSGRQVEGAEADVLCVCSQLAQSDHRTDLFCPIHECTILTMSIEEAFKVILSTGNYVPPLVPKRVPISHGTQTMNSSLRLWLISLPLLLAAAPAAPDNSPDPYPAATPKHVVSVTNAISPAVVRIDVAQATYRDGKQNLIRGIGSGVIIDQEGAS